MCDNCIINIYTSLCFIIILLYFYVFYSVAEPFCIKCKRKIKDCQSLQLTNYRCVIIEYHTYMQIECHYYV